MSEERRELDPTRRLLKVFGVKVTDYEERTGRLLAEAGSAAPADLLALTKEVIELTADLNVRMREMTSHVFAMQTRVLAEMKGAIERATGEGEP